MSLTIEEENSCSSTVTTPGTDDEKYLVITVSTVNKHNWYSKQFLPWALLSASILQIMFYITCNENLQKILRFEPYNLKELWRFFTYMLLHDDWLHLLLNVIMQIIFACFLECRHGSLRIFGLYLIGGMSGALGATCVHPDLVIGASAGVYALLISHIADMLMNFKNMKYKIYRCFCIIIIVASDITFNIVHIFSKEEPLISWGAHVFGGITGLLIGFVLLQKDASLSKLRRGLFVTIGIIIYIILLISITFVIKQIRKCTPFYMIHKRYIYFC